MEQVTGKETVRVVLPLSWPGPPPERPCRHTAATAARLAKFVRMVRHLPISEDEAPRDPSQINEPSEETPPTAGRKTPRAEEGSPPAGSCSTAGQGTPQDATTITGEAPVHLL